MKREYPGRQLAIGRKLAVGRMPAVGRKPIPVAPKNGKFNVILDTNILISSLISSKKGYLDGAPYRIFEELNKDSFNLIQPNDLYEEYVHELARLSLKGEVDRDLSDQLLNLINSKKIVSRSYVTPPVTPVDPDDRAVFNTSMLGDVDFVVSMDHKHLHKKTLLGKPKKLKIVSPGDFLRILLQ